MNDRTRKLLPVAIFGVLLAVAIVIRMNPPEPQERRSFGGPVMTVETQVMQPVQYKVMLESYGTGSGHVFNLGHGIHQTIDPDNVKILVDAVHELSEPFHR